MKLNKTHSSAFAYTAAFYSQVFKHPRQLGAIAPSSKGLTALLMECASLDTANTVVELGPGTGVFSRSIIESMPTGATYIGIEQNAHFAQLLTHDTYGSTIVHGSAEYLSSYLSMNAIDHCDRIISGLPWLVLDEELQDAILNEITSVLADDGCFLTLAYSPFHYLPAGKRLRRKLDLCFEEVVLSRLVWNFPPASIYICRNPRKTSPHVVNIRKELVQRVFDTGPPAHSTVRKCCVEHSTASRITD